MLRILHFLSGKGAFLFEKYNCKIVDSEYISTFGGTGSITLQYNWMELRFYLDRDRLFLDINAAGDKSKHARYTFGIVKQLLTGKVDDHSLIDDENVGFLLDHFEAIADSFSKPNLAATKSSCKLLDLAQSKRLFG